MQSIQLFFLLLTALSELQFPCICRAKRSFKSLPAPQRFPRAQGIVGLHRGPPRPRPLHLSPPCCPRVTAATRGLRLPACVARSPCPGAPLAVGKPSPEPSHQPSRRRARYLKSRQARRRFSSAPLLLRSRTSPARPAPRRGRSRSPSGGVRWRRWSGLRGSGLSGWAGRSRVASSPAVPPTRRGARRT